MKKSILISLSIVAFIVMTQVAMAQPPPPPVNPAAVPLDGGLSLLLAAGAGLGVKKAWDKRKKRSINPL